MIVTSGAVDFLRARPSVKHRSMSEIARFQPCFRIWRPVSMLPRKSFLRPARFALASKPRPRPESRDSPGITAKQRETSPGGGIRAERLVTQEWLRGRVRFAKSPIIRPDLDSGTTPSTLPKFVRNCRLLCQASRARITPRSPRLACYHCQTGNGFWKIGGLSD